MDEQRRNRPAMRTVRRSLIGAGVAALALAAGGAWALRDEPPACLPKEDTVVSTPYPALLPPATYIQGATLDVSGQDGDLFTVLRAMRDGHGINTVTVYGLERWRTTRLDALFTALQRLGMRIAVRVEWYDQQTFAFRPEDAGTVLEAHRALLAYAAGHRDQVAYVMLNMPVDDPAVQERLGGVNSALSRERQVAYATAVVPAVRAEVGATRVFLGLFYGWDGSYDVPSYRPGHPDGYVLTNYSYPEDGVAGADSEVTDIINESRLRTIAERATGEAGDAPIIVEYGFHTLTYQNGNMPDQVAGLVADPATKKKALRATTQFYCDRYPNVIGTMYFGYNIYKPEGVPPRRLDFGLVPE
jgi:hypothetical protein